MHACTKPVYVHRFSLICALQHISVVQLIFFSQAFICKHTPGCLRPPPSPNTHSLILCFPPLPSPLSHCPSLSVSPPPSPPPISKCNWIQKVKKSGEKKKSGMIFDAIYFIKWAPFLQIKSLNLIIHHKVTGNALIQIVSQLCWKKCVLHIYKEYSPQSVSSTTSKWTPQIQYVWN